jgi:hypothetical protein
MAQTGESYAEAARQLADPVSPQDVLDAASREFGIPDGALSMVLRHLRETSDYPLLAAAAPDRLKVYLDLKDWVALAKARLGRPEFPHELQDSIMRRTASFADAAARVWSSMITLHLLRSTATQRQPAAVRQRRDR